MGLAEKINDIIVKVNGKLSKNGKAYDSDRLDGLDSTYFEKVSSKGVSNGYAGLDGTGKVPLAQLPNLETSISLISDSAILDGKPLVLNQSNGRVSQVTGSGTTIGQWSDNVTGCTISDYNRPVLVRINNATVLLGYRDSSTGNGMLRIGTHTNTSNINFESPVSIASGNISYFKIEKLGTSNDFLIYWMNPNNSNYCTARIASVNGTTITLGATTVVVSESIQEYSACYINGATTKFLLAVRTGSNHGKSYIITVDTSTKAITTSLSTTFASSSCHILGDVIQVNNLDQYAVGSGYSGKINIFICTVYNKYDTTTSVAYNQPYPYLHTGQVQGFLRLKRVSDGTFMIMPLLSNNGYYTVISSCKLSGNSLTISNEKKIINGYSTSGADFTVTDLGSNLMVTYTDDANSYRGAILNIALNSDKTIGKVGNPIYFSTLNGKSTAITSLDYERKCVIFTILQSEQKAVGAIVTSDNSTAWKYIGLANSQVVGAGLSVKISTLGQINTKQSGLIAGLTYYISSTGGLVAYDTGLPEIGKALTPTSILLTSKGV